MVGFFLLLNGTQSRSMRSQNMAVRSTQSQNRAVRSTQGGRVVSPSKMLGLYLFTIIIGHKRCNMLSILSKLTLQKKVQNIVTNNVFDQS